MGHTQEILNELGQLTTIYHLTGVFESLASTRIAQIKNQVLQSQQFFQELWHIYNQLRVDDTFRYGRRLLSQDISNKELLIVITAEGGFSGDIDQKLIGWMLENYDKERHDIVVIGHHGAIQLAQHGVGIKRYYKLPVKDQNINVLPIINEVQHYRTATAYYQTYVSLLVQDIKRIELRNAVRAQIKDSKSKRELITEETYILEPSAHAVVDHLERSMMHIALSQIILESKLAQYASRFRAMSVATEKAREMVGDTKLRYNRARRSQQDERIREVMNGLRTIRSSR